MDLNLPSGPLDLRQAIVMGILNVTPDSFSDGGEYLDHASAVARAGTMVSEGARIIDIGGESTRPGADPVSEEEERRRVVPVIRELVASDLAPVSVDTSKPGVMAAAVEAGAEMINDVNALRTPGALETAAELGVPICLMHMQGDPRTMQSGPCYEDVVEEVYAFLSERAEACVSKGMDPAGIVIDPGFGFGKTLSHNLTLMRHLERFLDAGLPLLVGVSRKSLIGAILDRPADERLPGSLALAAVAALKGANIVRAHDVKPTAEVLAVVGAVRGDILKGRDEQDG